MLVALSCAGSLNGNSLVVTRLTVAAANKGYAPKVLGQEIEIGAFNLGSSEVSTFPEYEDSDVSDVASEEMETSSHPPL